MPVATLGSAPVFADFSIISGTFLAALAVVSTAILAGIVAATRHHRWAMVASVLLALTVLTSVNTAAWLNHHFEYLRTWDELFGKRAADAASLRALHSQAGMPAHGQVIELPIPASASRFSARSAQIYLPPAYFQKPRPRLGVVLLLAGEPGSPLDWTRGGLADVTSDHYAASHGGRAPVLVMADENGSYTGDSECIGAAETYLTRDVPDYVSSRLGLSRDPTQWAVGGLSEGGTCGLMLALRHPDEFRTFIDFAGLLGPRTDDSNAVGTTVHDHFRGDEAAFRAHEPPLLLAQHRYDGLGAWFEVGTADGPETDAQRVLAPAARAAGIGVCATEISGGEHTFAVWANAFKHSLPWLAGRLEGVPITGCGAAPVLAGEPSPRRTPDQDDHGPPANDDQASKR